MKVGDIDFNFLMIYPNGVEDELWINSGRKYDMSKLILIYETYFNREYMKNAIDKRDYEKLSEQLNLLISKSMVISTFEKIAFRNFISFDAVREYLITSLYEVYYVNFGKGFNNLVESLSVLKSDKKLNANAGKWPVVTFLVSLKNRDEEVLVKPSTIKKLIVEYDMNVNYKTTPNLETYSEVRNEVLDFRKNTSIKGINSNVMAQAIMYCV